MKLQTPLQVFTDVPPAQVLNRCASCKSREVFEFEGDLFCNPCGWNSIESRVENQLAIMTATHRKEQAGAVLNPTAAIEDLSVVMLASSETNIQSNVA